jgi:hypothetical protein
MHRQRLAHDRSVPKEVDVRRTEPHSLRARARQEAEQQEGEHPPTYSGPEVADEARALRFAGSRKSALAC